MKILNTALLVILCSLLFACEDNQKYINACVGQKNSLPIEKLEDKNGDIINYSWTTSDNSIIKVDQNGNYKVLKDGEATITAIGDDKQKSEFIWNIKSTYNNKKAKLSNNNLSLTIGKSKKVTVEGTLDPNITWKSDNKNLKIKNGVITASKAGSYEYTATLSDNTVLTGNIEVKQDNSKSKTSQKKATTKQSTTTKKSETTKQSTKNKKSTSKKKKTTKTSKKTQSYTNGIDRSKKYVINTNSMKIHYSDCYAIDRMKDHNAVSTNSLDGYQYYDWCKKCSE